MRLIKRKDIELRVPGDWKKRAAAALEEIKALPPARRAEAINRKSRLWSELKPILEAVSAGKCWYCESGQARFDKSVDHFRPKNRVSESESGDGYWWLAFDWQNYRYSCTYCNSRRTFEHSSGGKQDHFPLFDETARGRPEASWDELAAQEQIKLLDPTDPEDVKLITYDVADGSPAPSPRHADPTAHERVKVSIEVYHLHEKGLQSMRFSKMLDVRKDLRAAEKLECGQEYKDLVADLARAIDTASEYSAAARAMLMSLRGESKLAVMILEDL